MKIAIFTILFLGTLTLYGNEEKNDTWTSSQSAENKKISNKQLCEIKCETKFSKCYDKKKQSGFKCAADAVTCKNKCK